MSGSQEILKGVIHGRTIELDRPPGLPDGQQVTIEIRPIPANGHWLDRIVVDPAIRPGQPTVAGTTVAADEIVRLLGEGRTEEELLQAFPTLTSEDIQAVRDYARVPEGLRRSFGAWAGDGSELDAYLDINRRSRKGERRGVGE
jgi:uncharacterized protein (DUF433 family)